MKVLKRINYLTYRLKLPSIIKIYNVILVIYLKLVIVSTSDSYKRYFIALLSIIVDNKKKYKIKRLIRKRQYRYNYAR